MLTFAFLQLFLPPAKTENIRAKCVLPSISLHGYILTEIQPFRHTDRSYKEVETLAHKKSNLFSICLNMHEYHFSAHLCNSIHIYIQVTTVKKEISNQEAFFKVAIWASTVYTWQRALSIYFYSNNTTKKYFRFR